MSAANPFSAIDDDEQLFEWHPTLDDHQQQQQQQQRVNDFRHQDADDPEAWLFRSSPPIPRTTAHAHSPEVNSLFYAPQSPPPLPRLPEHYHDRSSSFGYFPDSFFAADHDETGYTHENATYHSLLDRRLNPVRENYNMPPRQPQRAAPAVVDLTEQSSPIRPTSSSSAASSNTERPHKRSINSSDSEDHQRKRRRQNGEPSRSRREDVEEIDLSGVNENPSAEEELLQAQQERAIAEQQSKEPKRQRIGQRQCIICMENYTNVTMTSCGHIYCHECLWQALKAGERNGSGQGGPCPVCRKRIIQKRPNSVIPVAFMTKKEYKKQAARRQQEA